MSGAPDRAPIVVVCALERELASFRVPAGVEILRCGVGPVDAAIAVARRLTGAPVRALISAGIGGAFAGCGEVGDAVAIVHEQLADLGLEGGAPLVLPDGAKVTGEATAHDELVRLARASGLRLARGLTVTLVTTTDATGAERRDRYGAEVESMEGFAVLHAAALAGVPAIELRGISNFARDRTASHWDFSAGARAVGRALDALLPSLLQG